MAYYFFNLLQDDEANAPPLRERAAERLRVGMWGVGEGERHRDMLAPGDVVLIYLGAPKWEFIGRAKLATSVHDWTLSEAEAYPGDAPGGVLLASIEEWDQPVPIDAVLSQLDTSGGAKADHKAGVLQLTTEEYETTLAVAGAARRY